MPRLILPLAAIAAICHEANRTYCQFIGDHTQNHWEDAPQWQRDSAIHGVEAIADGRTTQPSDSHQAWMDEKHAAGWAYGETKDPERKRHPCLVPFDMLPFEQQAKDELFFGIARVLLDASSR